MPHPTWHLDLDIGGLVLTPCPGTKGVSLEDSLTQLKSQGVQAIVTALSEAELINKGVESLGAFTQKLGMQWFQIEIEDDDAPSDEFQAKWDRASSHLHAILEEDGNVALHCMGGSGRTGLLAAHLLLEQGWALDDIVREVQALRPGAFTKPIQIEYIKGVADR
jgi:protein-tyrosine phosphatase